ncbi:helix-turn-helix domain-containing protein [Parabacteroides sp. AM08-6]|uniref:AraC family transcriptional regulator n=1 Tax=Parabacteroides sp. AM08-6 TaxID=2292053 RepID=UPI000EFE0EB9|nr:helix-turn-helix domain-containing protein [Parabacteroides sp. AM08-6]RHJ84763.1 AraC family transcriptional regulator [Parabacteroides sp. AM08-6]
MKWDIIQFLLSLQIIGFCIFGGTILLLRSRERRAKKILGFAMYLWAVMAIVRVSVNFYLHEGKEAFHPDVLIIGCFVTAILACYVIEVLRPGYLTLKRFAVFISPIFLTSLMYLAYRLSGGEIHVYYSLKELLEYFNFDVFMRGLFFLLTLFYMLLPVYLILRYSGDYKAFLSENVSNPDDYDLDWLKKTMIVLMVLYGFYLILLLTDILILYVVNKAVLLLTWFYFFYKALFLKPIILEHSFKNSWNLPYQGDDESDDYDGDEEQRGLLSKRYAEEVNQWFEKEKPYLRDDLRLTDLQRIFPMSRSYLSQLFNRELGMSFSDYVNQFRIEESKRLMDAEPQASIQEVAERSGFHSISTFRRAFQKYTGTIPSEYKRN